MNITDFPFLRPTVTLKPKHPKLAYFGHIISMIGGFFLLVSGFFTFFGKPIAFLGVLTGSFILVVELDNFSLPPLKDPMTRGIIWMLLAAFSIGVSMLAIIITFVGGACYIVYSNR